MRSIVVRRLAGLPFTLLGLSVVVFACLRLVPGDPVDVMLGENAAPGDVAALRTALGLDLPFWAQLQTFVGRALHGDFGHSIAFRAPVAAVIADRCAATLQLAAAALCVALALAIPLGVVAAVRRGRWTDRIVRTVSLLGTCVPGLFLGPLFVLLFSIELGWLPVSGRGGLAHLVLPATTLGIGMAGLLVRLTRTNVLAVLEEPWVRTAVAKGASNGRTVVVHVLRVALLPVLTVVGLQMGSLLAGAVVTETIFAWPGLGRLVVQAIGARDYPLVQGCVLVLGVTTVVSNTVTDVLCAWLDPRARQEGA